MECASPKKYEKVDSFLKRYLPQSRYTGVRLIEPCVAVSDVYNKQFKFVVLADEWLYVTENPPKTAKDIQEVTRIVDIISVELINDVPEFLGGDLKYKTHHILVTYKKVLESNVTTQLSTKSSSISMSKSLQDNEFRNLSKKSTSFDKKGNDGENATPSGRISRKIKQNLSKSLQENDLKHSTHKSNRLGESDSSPGMQGNLSRSLPENELQQELEEEYLFGQDKSKNPKHNMSPILSLQKGRVKKKSRNSLHEDDINDRTRVEQNILLPRAGTLQKTSGQKSNTSNKLSLSGPNSALSDEGNHQIDRQYENFESNLLPLHHSFSTIDDFKHKNSPTRLTVSASAVDLRAMKVKFDSSVNSGSEPNLTSTQKRSLFSWFKGRSGSKNAGLDKSSGQFSGDFDESLVEEGSSEINLYMTLDDSVMLAYLRSTWENCLLNSSVKFAKEERSPKTVVKNKPNSSTVTALFDQIEKEILNSEDFQATFELVHELHTACQKDVLVKKLFWQSPDLYVFLVKNINDCIKKNHDVDEPMRRNRADELEFVLLLIECLTEMFRETELLASRMIRLKSKKYSVVRDLILASITSPELTKTSSVVETPDISEAAEVLLTGKLRKKKETKEKSSQDTELENISNELVKHQIALLHELFIVAYQAVWFPSDDRTLSISWIIKIVESSTTTKRFLQAYIQQVMEIVKKAEDDYLTSDDTRSLYTLFSVLKTLLQHSIKLRKHIHEYYTEEFRYYIKPHSISNSLPEDCPLTSSTRKLVDDVIDLVTDLPMDNRRPPR
ncbi:uncharacterized protein C12orf56 homolog [Dendronephthya gigantea]|uniref:uncharacterized protein C12orf56 homolog n=1 Tax=Dendronephthya gigantea TaxID=151771 RepID=UPI00106CD120|nr:uncharacterized protein C12orf56 homolog [Dendronephthya gigantea]